MVVTGAVGKSGEFPRDAPGGAETEVVAAQAPSEEESGLLRP